MNIDKEIEKVKEIIEHKDDYDVAYGYRFEKPCQIDSEKIKSIENVLSELKKKDKIIFETKKYLENMTKSSIRDKDGYYLGNWYVLQPYELEDVIDILKGKEKDE